MHQWEIEYERQRELRELREALQAFLKLTWVPDGGPATYFEVGPIDAAHAALKRAGELLNGVSPFPADIDGTVMMMSSGKRMVWLGGMAYDEDRRHLVPVDKLDIFDAALREG